MKKPDYLDRGLEITVREIFDRASKAINKYDNPHILFSGVNEILPLFDNDKFKEDIYIQMQEHIKERVVKRQNSVFNYEVVKGPAIDPTEEERLLTNLEVNKEKFENYALSKKDSILSKIKDHNGNTIEDLLNEGSKIIKHHNYQVSNVKDKIYFQIENISTPVSQKKLKELVKSIYVDDIDYQISNLNYISNSGLNVFKHSIHSEHVDLQDFKLKLDRNTERAYGVKLNKEGYDLIERKLVALTNKKNNIDQEFNKFYDEIYPVIESKVQNLSEKQTLLTKLKNVLNIDEIDYGPAKSVLDRSDYVAACDKQIKESLKRYKI